MNTLLYEVEGSDDLSPSSWSTVWSSTGTNNLAGPVLVPDNQLLSGHPRRFLRLRVSY